MPLVLSEIYFNHNRLTESRKPLGSSPFTSALHIRRNQDLEIPWPEYKAEDLRDISESKIAYSIKDTAGYDVFIFVLLEDLSKTNTTYEVKAEGGGILGELCPTTVVFGRGNPSANATFPLRNRVFEEIGIYDVTWDWYYREQGDSLWKFIDTTHHHVYLTYSAPEMPWSKDAYRKNNPWTELLDICCEISQGAKDDISAVAEITKAINNRYGLRYDIIAGAPRYTFTIYKNNKAITVFDLVNWINFVLNGNPPSNLFYLPGTMEEYKHYHIVGCQDTAAALAVMASVIGAKVDVAYHPHFGYLKYVFPIGRGKSNNPYTYLNPSNPGLPIKGEGDERTKFQFHYYVKLRGNTYDSCMREWSENSGEEGWLINLPQFEYEEKTIDRRTPKKREMNSICSADGTLLPSIPELTDLEILLT